MKGIYFINNINRLEAVNDFGSGSNEWIIEVVNINCFSDFNNRFMKQGFSKIKDFYSTLNLLN